MLEVTHPNPPHKGSEGTSSEEEPERHEFEPLHRPGDESVL